MAGQNIAVASSEGSEFSCYIALPDSAQQQTPAPAVIIMASIFGVDADVQNDVERLAGQGFVAAAPDLFWRGDAGPKPRTEAGMQQARARAKDRAVLIDQGVQDLADVIAELDRYAEFNGNTMVVGLCYGGPFAILGPARLGCAAGVSFHGTKVEDFLDELDQVNVPLSLHWGDQDHAAPAATLARIKTAISDRDNIDLAIYSNVAHGYTAPSSTAWDEQANAQSWQRAQQILVTL